MAKKSHAALISILLLVLCTLLVAPGRAAQGQAAVVRGVLFYSPTCGHCHYVISEVLPPLVDRYGDRLQIVGVDISIPAGQTLYRAAVQHFAIPDGRLGVPTLIIGDKALVGSGEIPEQLPGLVEAHLAAGGVAWPAIPGLAAALETRAPTPQPQRNLLDEASAAIVEAVQDPDPSLQLAFTEDNAAADDVLSRIARDPVGNGLAIVVLVGMIAVLRVSVWRARRFWRVKTRAGRSALSLRGVRAWAIPMLCVIGLGISLYMAYVETTHTAAVCGPVGDCNTVQQSDYAALFGLIPIGILGIFGYAAILLAWLGARRGQGQLRRWSGAALLGMAFFGVLFSIYLTFLEPFVIGATCLWCLSSAVCMTLILVFAVEDMPRSLMQSAGKPRRAAA